VISKLPFRHYGAAKRFAALFFVPMPGIGADETIQKPRSFTIKPLPM